MLTRTLLVGLAVLAVCTVATRPKWHQLTADYTFDQYLADFHKSHSSNEYEMRKSIFQRKLAHILDFNVNSGASYKKGVNHLTDLTAPELAAMNGRLPNSQVQQPAPSATYSAAGATLPASVDYRNVGTLTGGNPVLTAVKDQGMCGSCWAHAATESIETHYALFNVNSGASYKKGVNHLTDLTAPELAAMNGRLPNSQVQQPAPSATYSAAGATLPASVDYRNVGTLTGGNPVLTAVKDQGMCGSCWAHAATESIETHYALATGQLYTLSQQQVTSCTNNTQQCGGTGGCYGATAQIGWEYVQNSTGITEEWMYGYTSYFGDSGMCLLNANMSGFVSVTGYTQVDSNNASATLEALVKKGPLAIAVDASTWNDYESGIFTGCNYANNISIDHAVQLIGYGYDSVLQKDYWLVRNSWSATFGELGFIRLERASGEEQCGYNVDWIGNGGGCPGGVNVTYTCGQCGILYDVAFPNVANIPPPAPPSGSFVSVVQDPSSGVAMVIVYDTNGTMVETSALRWTFQWPLVEVSVDTNTQLIHIITYPESIGNATLYKLAYDLTLVSTEISSGLSYFDLEFSAARNTFFGIAVTSPFGRELSRFTNFTAPVEYTPITALPYMWYVNASTIDPKTSRYFGLLNYFPGQPGFIADQKLAVGNFADDTDLTTATKSLPSATSLMTPT
ncbi:cysteine peptidase, putative [Bodo saltans]|uniref:Cysteine peptidase, putative n=1 Tax=Bodo saltans TaxID=75058 RepID=A0A0S4IL38_BODSA|nr:cysteine peptidase, putative [Bodo saltans]|eukprot:CUF20208.1 cysteine peptidase, putative [Bodo saltans]